MQQSGLTNHAKHKPRWTYENNTLHHAIDTKQSMILPQQVIHLWHWDIVVTQVGILRK